MSRHKSGFTIIELLIVVVVIAILTAIAVPKFQQVKGRARAATMRADLRNLATAQENYLSLNLVYANNVSLLADYTSSEGVVVTISSGGTGGGWSATATHPLSYPLVCAIYHGSVAPLAPATREGVITCA
jgi:prepilin-type N-terminal cleavage/methylation domain-containing protein